MPEPIEQVRRPEMDDLLQCHSTDPLAFSYGFDLQGAKVSTTLAQASPLLVLDSTGATYPIALATILTQLYAKQDGDALRVVFIEQRMLVTPVFEPYQQTTFVVKSQEGLQTALLYLDEALQSRKASATCTPAWLVVLALEDSLYRAPEVLPVVKSLLTEGGNIGMYSVLVATARELIALHLLTSFQQTLILPGGDLQKRQEAQQNRAVLLHASLAFGPTPLTLPSVDPHLVRALIAPSNAHIPP
jgi:hypothetical protein